MSEIKWVEGEIPRPGVCVSCGSADHAGRRFVTFTKMIRRYGQILLCDQCVTTILKLDGLDYVPRIEMEMAKTEAKVYRERVEPAMDALRNIRESFTAVCDEYLTADGTPKAPSLTMFKSRSARPAKSAGNPLSNASSGRGFFDEDPNDAA